jgi:hypothetical protein
MRAPTRPASSGARLQELLFPSSACPGSSEPRAASAYIESALREAEEGME